MQISVKANFLSYRYKSPDFSILNLEVLNVRHVGLPFDDSAPTNGNIISATGSLPDLPITNGTQMDVSGEWVSHPKYGKQIKITSIQIVSPKDVNGIESYLSSGIIKGIGEVTARGLVQKFGVKTLEILDKSPERIKEVSGIGGKTYIKIINSWKQQRETANLLTTLCSLGLSIIYARKILRLFGDDAAKKIKNNPYILVQVHGIGFLKADKIAINLGIHRESSERITAGILYTLYEASKEGHCYLPETHLIDKAKGILSVNKNNIKKEIQYNSNPIFNDIIVHNENIYLKEIYEAERYVANRINELACYHPLLNDIDVSPFLHKCELKNGFKLTDEQAEAVKTVLTQARLSVISGLPGVGKTTSVKAILNILGSLKKTFLLAAPTGKAAKRLSEQTDCEAKTIHRLLEFRSNGSFAKNEENPLTADFIIIDEVSMVNILLMEKLFRAIGRNTWIVLIGDPNQLPPIGPGNVLRDLLNNALCPSSKLVNIQRQAADSTIIKVAHYIHAGYSLKSTLNSEDYLFVKEDDPENVKEKIVNLVAKNKLFSPDQIQVLAPMKKGVIGVKELNIALQDKLNKQEEINYTFTYFRLGDRVIQTVNNYKKEIFNGEVGYIVDIDADNKEVFVSFNGNKIIKYEDDELSELQLAYCLTVHKSQGSEFPCVVIPIHTQHYIMLFRNLIYTAITRAKQSLILVGTEKAMDIAIKNNKQLERYSDLNSF